ncbi:carbohydrate-binding family 9-like protein [Anaeromassilibacillus senegalensis]|uniref:Carbohydrate-binding family 9-like protein n=1 Tax=Anaeromassilibacillus senegalensis TaxID=1673717 RepID=A0ABS9CLG0_9FIRM|nr:carbohydrate-binding family 9-like protein [Anaeromassilibacillus senegalensis]MCF2651062.1 carbohydrate-binding family 9-like protein [Anaeromassilibacillus senegalensis]MCI5651430.1 carbohydrate-binding family 9-like protein [Ruminococcus bromii]
MKNYVIQRVSGTPDWSGIPALAVDEVPWTGETDIRMIQQIGYDENALYIHQRAWEKDIRAEHTSLLSSVCEDSCMEFFFSPEPADGRYFNFEFNLNGCMFLGFGHGRSDSIRLIPGDHKTLFHVRTERLSDGWEIYYEIPLAFLHVFYPDYTLEPGRVIRANCYKCGDKTVREHYMMWNPTTSDTPDFHRPQDFGEMEMA